MSKPIDQELLPCPFCGCQVGLVTGFEYHTVRGDHSLTCPFLDDEPVASAEEWNTRAAVQPASVAVPEGSVLVPEEATLVMQNAGWQEAERQGVDPESIEMLQIWSAMLAAAPHPVSGEQTVDQHKAAYWQEQYELLSKDYQRSLDERAQDVAGLVAEVERISKDYEFRGPGCDAELAITEMREALVEALSDWRKSHDS